MPLKEAFHSSGFQKPRKKLRQNSASWSYIEIKAELRGIPRSYY